MANPNSDSGIKLPKLLPRFVTSREWTQAEAIKLLDDLAYYSTQPIVARVAKAKLPSGPLWRTEVEFADIPVKISKWSEAKDGLRVGMRVVDADWRIGLGGGARVELWLHNAGDKDVTFKTTGPDRQDTGVAVGAIDAEGREHWADGVNVHIYAGPMDCKLPAGHVALAKRFEVTFAEPGLEEKMWLTPRFHGLKHGKYQLRCKWMDAYPDISKPGEWKGELTAPDHAFTLAAAVAAADLEAKPAPKLGKLPLAAAAETPKTTEQKAFTAWGQEVGGLQIGLQLGEQRVYRVGESAILTLRLRNNGKENVPLQQGDEYFLKNPPAITDANGKAVMVKAMSIFGSILLRSVAPGKEVDWVKLKLDLRTETVQDQDAAWTLYGTGKFQIQYENVPVVGESNVGQPQTKLATGKLELEVKEPEKEPFTAWGKEVGGLQAGLGFKAGEKRVYRHGETATLVVRVRNVGQNDIKFKYYPTFLSENSPTVLDETGKRVSLRGNMLRIVKRDVPTEVNLAVGKEIELYERELRLASGNEDAGELKTRDIFPTGKFLIQHEQVIGNSAQGFDKFDPALEKLATGKLELEVTEDLTAWGKEVGGLQAGLGFKTGENRVYSPGETVPLVVRVRNVGKEAVKFRYVRQFFLENPPVVTDGKGKSIALERVTVYGFHALVPVALEPGKEIEVGERQLVLKPALFGTGKFGVQYERLETPANDKTLSELATGKLELDVKAAPAVKEPVTAWGKEVGGLQAGLGFKAGEQRAYRHGETVPLVIRVRNVGNKSLSENPCRSPCGEGELEVQ